MTDFTKWGIGPDDVSGGQSTQSVSEPDFNAKWGLGETSPAVAVSSVASTQPQRTLGDKFLKDTFWGKLISQSGQALASPGNAYASTPDNPVTTEQLIAPATNLAGLIGSGSIPAVIRAGESSLPVINNLVKGLRPQVKPLIDSESGKLAALAIDKYDIPLHGGQISENRTANYMDNMLNSGGYGDQRSAFNRAISRTFGQDSDKITPDVMLKASKELGANFDAVAANTTAKLDEPLISGLNKINDATTFLQPSEQKAISSHINHVLNVAAKNNGEIDGKTLQDLFRRGSPLDLATRDSNSNIRHYASQIKSEMLDTMGRYAPDEMKSLYTQTKYQYKNMKTIEDLAEKAPTGDISPSLLMGAVRKSYQDMAYGGGGDLADLARIGQRFLKEPPQSGTQPRQAAAKLLGLGGIAGAEGMLGAVHDPVLAAKLAGITIAGGAATKLTSAAIGKFLRSDSYTNRLINSAVPGRGSNANSLQKLVNTGYLPPGVPMPILPLLQSSPPQ